MNNGNTDLGDLVQRGYRFALSLTHNATLAEDIIQDAWFSVLKANGPWKRQYLFTAIRHRFIDHCRRENRVAFEPLLDQPELNYDANSELEPDDWSIDETKANTNGAFDRALNSLRDQERAVLYLAAVEGMTASQIGELLEWPRGTVLSMLFRGREKVRNSMKADS